MVVTVTAESGMVLRWPLRPMNLRVLSTGCSLDHGIAEGGDCDSGSGQGVLKELGQPLVIDLLSS